MLPAKRISGSNKSWISAENTKSIRGTKLSVLRNCSLNYKYTWNTVFKCVLLQSMSGKAHIPLLQQL